MRHNLRWFIKDQNCFVFLSQSVLVSISTSMLLEHTTALCKSYEDKHSALQDRLKATSLRRKCLSCSFQRGRQYCQGLHLTADSEVNYCLILLCNDYSGTAGSCVLARWLHSELQWTAGGEWTLNQAQTAVSGSNAKLIRNKSVFCFCWQV